MMTAALRGVVEKYDLKGQVVGDVALGAVIKHSRDWNLARESVIDSGLSMRTPGVDLQRACATSLEAAIMLANKIALGQIESGIAGGTDTTSDAPIVFKDAFRRILLDGYAARSFGARLKPWLRFRPSMLVPEFPAVTEPRTGLSMGREHRAHGEGVGVLQREHQDQLALASHTKAAAAYDSGFYEDLVVPFDGLRKRTTTSAATRRFEKLSALKPVFSKAENGTMTAGNSTPLTDGAAAVLLASEDWARKKNLPRYWLILPLAKVAAVDLRQDATAC